MTEPDFLDESALLAYLDDMSSDEEKKSDTIDLDNIQFSQSSSGNPNKRQSVIIET